MKYPNRIVAAVMTFVLALVLGGMPEYAAAQQSQNVPTAPGTTRVDPTQGPLAPEAEPAAPLPQGPQPQQQNAPAAQVPSSAPNQSAAQPQNQTEPLGTAAAEKARTVGGAASRPAGAAIAPAKQRQMRSLLLKVGAVLAAGAAVGIVYGLSKGTPSTPPGSNSPTANQR